MKSHAYKHRRQLVIILFLILFVFGISNVTDYGMYYDETAERTILLSNVKEYILMIFPEGSRLHSLSEHIEAIPISQSVERDHGIASYYGFLPFILLFGNNALYLMYAWHSYTFVLFFGGVIALYFLLKETYNSSALPVLGTLIFFFTPRVFADSHFNNKDIIFLALVIVTLLFAVRAMKYMHLRDIICFSVASGFMMNGKILGIAIWGLIGLFVIVYFVLRRSETPRKMIWYALLAIILSLLFYVLLTPASWANPIVHFQHCINNATHFTRWNSTIRFRGQVVFPATNGLPHGYLPQWIAMSTPVYISLLFIISCVTFVFVTAKTKGKNILSQQRDFLFLLFIAGFSFPFTYAVLKSYSFVLYTAWRHMYFLYAFYFLCAMYVLDLVLEKHESSTAGNTDIVFIVTACLVCTGFISTFADMIKNRSYEYVYFNPVARHLVDINGYEGDYWNVSIKSTLNGFADLYYDGEKPLKIGLVGYATGGQSRSALENEKIDIVFHEDADYLVFNTSADNRLPDMQFFEKVYAVNKYGTDLSAVYIRK